MTWAEPGTDQPTNKTSNGIQKRMMANRCSKVEWPKFTERNPKGVRFTYKHPTATKRCAGQRMGRATIYTRNPSRGTQFLFDTFFNEQIYDRHKSSRIHIPDQNVPRAGTTWQADVILTGAMMHDRRQFCCVCFFNTASQANSRNGVIMIAALKKMVLPRTWM